MLNMILNGDNGGGMDLMGGMQTMGIVNAMKTGDLYLDMLIAMLIPIFLRFAFDVFRRLDNNLSWANICKWWKSRSFKYERTIVYKYQRSYWGGTNNLDEDTQNTVLLKAIKFYLHQNCKLDFRDAMVDLTTIGRTQRNNYYDCYDSDDEDEDEKTMVGTLAKYKIVAKPKNGAWHSVGRYDGHVVEIMVSEEEEEDASSGDNNNSRKNVTSTKTFHFVSTGKTSIDTFIQKAYDWYLEQLRSLEDHSRYLYEIRQKVKTEDTDGGAMTYNRYKLSDEKTFESLFFRQKESLLNLMKHFQNKSGKYSIKGYPHKLGLLLHGVPGTGKTSLIKALAQHTGRSIVNIPLAKIETNSELMDIFFAKHYSVADQDVPVKLGFKDVIFVLEDVDAASKVVKRRVAEAAPKPTITVKTPWQLLLESNDEETREVVRILKEKSVRLKEAAAEADVLQSLAQRIGSVPGLGVINSKGIDREMRDEALEAANLTIDALETVDRYIGVHAKTIKASLDAGVEVSSAFEDALLGSYNEGAIGNVVSPNASEDVSLVEEGSQQDDVQQQMIVQAAMAMSTENNAEASTPAPGAAGPSLLLKPKKDELNLSGLLNVLDGVVDTPGRIVVMTTNHPEMLDPALIRPGRIDKKILLGYMGGADMIQMVELYFQTSLNVDQANRFRQVAAELQLTPAEIEQMAAENDLVEDMLTHLEARAGLVAAETPSVHLTG